eukprot:1158274-Pelagomonas_calceolata.AAC.28
MHKHTHTHTHTHAHSHLDLLDLAGHHRQHLCLNAVELIKAAPGTTLHQPTEDGPHGLVVQAFTAVEDHAEQGHGLGQIFGGLRLAWRHRHKRADSGRASYFLEVRHTRASIRLKLCGCAWVQVHACVFVHAFATLQRGYAPCTATLNAL